MPSQKSGTEMPIWLPMRAAWSTALPRRMADRTPRGSRRSQRAMTSAATASETVAGMRDITRSKTLSPFRKLTPKSPTAAWLR